MLSQVCRSQAWRSPNARSFLSDAYKCTEAWHARLQTPVLQRINVVPFYGELEKKFHQHGQVCAVDIDIYANRMSDNERLDDLADLIHKLRMTAETSNALDSTSHAVVRHHLDFGNDDIGNLIHLLDDRLSYGIFLDAYTANLTLDRLLKLKQYRRAAKVATLLMLQENFDNPISRTLSLVACFKYLESPEPLDEPIKQSAEELEAAAALAAAEEAAKNDPKASKAKRKKKVEEVRIRVKFLRNEFFDDHFDLKNSWHLVGKTLQTIGRHYDGAMGNSLALLGHCFYEKYEDGAQFIESLPNPSELYSEAVELVQKHLEGVTDRENDEHFKKFAESAKKLSGAQSGLADAITQLAKQAVSENETREIDEQTKVRSSRTLQALFFLNSNDFVGLLWTDLRLVVQDPRVPAERGAGQIEPVPSCARAGTHLR